MNDSLLNNLNQGIDNRPVRVLQIVNGIAIGDQSGGAEQFALRLAFALERPLYQSGIYVMCRYDSVAETSWVERLEASQIFVGGKTISYKPGLMVMKEQFSELWGVISEFRPDIINAHSERAALFASLIRCFHPLHPVAVRSVHIEREWITSPFIGVLVNQLVIPFCIHTEFAISEMIKMQLDSRPLSRLIGKTSILCPNAIDVGLVELPGGSTNYLPPGIPDIHPLIGTVGRLTKQKGYEYLLEAMKIVVQTHPVELVIIGTGVLEQPLRDKSFNYGLQNVVHFLGYRKDVQAILDRLDLFVSSSLWEGLPTVILEAMARNVPVVATDVSGSRELVNNGESGLLVQPGDAHRLAEAILFMLDDPEEARRLANNASQTVVRYSMRNTTDIYRQTYLKIAKNSSNL